MQLVTQLELWLSRRDVNQLSVSLTAALKRKRKTLLSPGHVEASCSSWVYNHVKFKICSSQITLNVSPCSLFKHGFLLSAYATPFFSCSIEWNQSSHWVFALCSSLPGITRYWLPGDWMKTSLSLQVFSIFHWLDRALIEKQFLALHFFFLCFGFLETWERSRSSSS